MKYPNKLYSVGESFVGKMIVLMELIPDGGIGVEDFCVIALRKMGVSELIDALTCMYMIQSIGVTNDNIIYKIC